MANDYTKTSWQNGSAPGINATNLNKIEQGIYDVHTDYVTEEGTINSWSYRKWASGRREAWQSLTVTTAIGTSNAGWYTNGSTGTAVPNFPSGLFTATPAGFVSAFCTSDTDLNVSALRYGLNRSATNFGNVCLARLSKLTTSQTYQIDLYAVEY